MEPIRVAIIGGGGGFFGKPHQMAASLDPERRVVAGVLSSDPDRSIQFGEEWGLDHPFATLDDLIGAHGSGTVPLGYAVVAVPNNQHAAVAIPLLRAGIPVLCEKPMADTMGNALAIAKAVVDTGTPLLLAHTYMGHPMVQLARVMVANGVIGKVRAATSFYLQGWLADPIETKPQALGHQQAQGRTTPAISGPTCCGGDIGSHAHIALEMVTGLEVKRVSAMLSSVVEGRTLDDDFRANCLLTDGVPATVGAEQHAIGFANHHGFRIEGSDGTLVFQQEFSEELTWMTRDDTRILRRNHGNIGEMYPEIATLFRLPGGHVEAFLEALGNCHRATADAVRERNGDQPLYPGLMIPGPAAGLRTMAFLAACIESSQKGSVMTALKHPGP